MTDGRSVGTTRARRRRFGPTVVSVVFTVCLGVLLLPLVPLACLVAGLRAGWRRFAE